MPTLSTPINTVQSPFLIIPEFISPLTCEEIIGEVNFGAAVFDEHSGRPQKTITMNKIADAFLTDVWEHGPLQQAESYFRVEIEDVTSIAYEWFPENYSPTAASPDAHKLMNGKWVRSSHTDFVGVLFLMDTYSGSGPIDTSFEVRGARLEFPSFKFGIKPQAGTMVLYPAAPNFANATSATEVGESFQARFHIRATRPYTYNPQNFPGTHAQWFS